MGPEQTSWTMKGHTNVDRAASFRWPAPNFLTLEFLSCVLFFFLQLNVIIADAEVEEE